MAKQPGIPLMQKTAYAVGMFVNNLQAAALPALMVVLNLGLGMDPGLVGIIGFVPRIFDAASDPILGYISDNSRTRWGRRRPYIFFGAVISGVVFAAMWQFPAGRSESFYFWFFLTLSSSYFVIYTLYSTPFVALGFEMTPDYHERTKVQAFANVAGLLPWLGVPLFYRIMSSDLFANKVEGASFLGFGVGLAMCFLGLIPALFCRENIENINTNGSPSNLTSSVEDLGAHALSFSKGILSALQCRPFMKLCVATFLVFNGCQIGSSFLLYAIKYYLSDGNDKTAGDLFAMFGMLTTICTFGVIPFTTWLSTKIGKRETFYVTISVSLIGYAVKWFAYNPQHPRWLLVACPLVAFGMGSLFTLMSSMVADACDYDELENGHRREGLFSAIYWWMVKLGIAISGLFFGYALKYSGFDVKLEHAQSEHTLLLLRLFDVAVPLLTSAIAIGVVATYPITEAKAREIRQALEERREGSKAHQ